MSNNIQWTVQVNVRDGQLDNAKALAKEVTVATQDKAGCRQYEWFFTADGSSCHILEEYQNSDAAIVHMGAFLSQFVERFLGCFEPTGVFVYGAPNDELKEIMKPFGAAYMGMVEGFVK